MNRTFTISALAFATVGLTVNAMAINTFDDRSLFEAQLPIIMNEDFESDPEREVLDNDNLLAAIGVGSTSPLDDRNRDGGSNGPVIPGQTRLFVDQLSTVNTYPGNLTLPGGDIGTNPALDNEVLRPVYQIGDEEYIEDGKLEYGKVAFEAFDANVRGFGMDLIDVERAPGTVVTVNLMSGTEYIIPAGADDEAQFFGFTTDINDPIKSVVVDLGFVNENFGGRDGVVIDNVTTGAVPEPTTMAALGLGAMALLRRRNRNK
ncbi:MAG: PEP-CTERM sorting domain-containing protein [Fimbriimonadaceae bacterium]